MVRIIPFSCEGKGQCKVGSKGNFVLQNDFSFISRYSEYRNLPVGDSKGKIRSLKARVGNLTGIFF